MVVVVEFFKYTDDKWLARRSSASWLSPRERGGDWASTNHSARSVHSCAEEKNQVLRTLTHYGIETTVDRDAKKQRIHEWIRSSSTYRSKSSADLAPSSQIE